MGRGQTNASKLHAIRGAGYNLGLLMRKAFGLAKPQPGGFLAVLVLAVLGATIPQGATSPCSLLAVLLSLTAAVTVLVLSPFRCQENHHFLTGC